jgi:RNA polymerase sigma-70 factor (ECF subfamily)
VGFDVDAVVEEPPDNGSLEIDEEKLQQALIELPDEYRIVLVMFYFEGCSYREIAEQLELPPGTVMSRLARAKAHLRKRLLPPVEPQSETPDVERAISGFRAADASRSADETKSRPKVRL